VVVGIRAPICQLGGRGVETRKELELSKESADWAGAETGPVLGAEGIPGGANNWSNSRRTTLW